MIELKNSKTTYRGKSLDGRERFASDSAIGALQMSEDGQAWQDILPRFIRGTGGWYSSGAPYYASVRDDGTRLFCPDRNERSKYIKMLSTPLLQAASKVVISTPSPHQAALPDRIAMATTWGAIHFILTNTGLKFEVFFREAPPPELANKFVFGIDSVGFDIQALLENRAGTIGIPRPQLMSDSEDPEDMDEVRRLDWSFKNGEMELRFDLAGLKFPLVLKNTTVDVQVGATADDGCRYTGSAGFTTGSQAGQYNYIGYNTNSIYLHAHHFCRFTGVTVAGTVSNATVTYYPRYDSVSPQLKVYGVDEDNPAAPTSAAEFDADSLTDAAIDWDTAWVKDVLQSSPDIASVIQELVDSYTISNEAVMLQIKNDKGENAGYAHPKDYGVYPNDAARLHIEYSVGAAFIPRITGLI